ncbi:hypothetical protein [Streptomyces collinus]|nr:hypothetical protein [Streptomyces collinus]
MTKPASDSAIRLDTTAGRRRDNMPQFMDVRHGMNGITADQLMQAHGRT